MEPAGFEPASSECQIRNLPLNDSPKSVFIDYPNSIYLNIRITNNINQNAVPNAQLKTNVDDLLKYDF